MAIAITSVLRLKGRHYDEALIEFTGPASYTTGGETLTAAQQDTITGAGPGQALDIDKLLFYEGEHNATGKLTFLDKANDKILFFTAAHAQETSTTDLSALTYRARILCNLRTS